MDASFFRHPYGQDDRKFLLEFIGVYHKLPSLWNTKCIEYCDRRRKSADYEILLKKFRERYPKADKADMKRKINSIRTNYRRELKRIQDHSYGGIKSEPTLWYFHELSFIKDTESADMPRRSDEKSTMNRMSARPAEIRPISSVKLPPTLVRKPTADKPSLVIPDSMPPLARLPQIKVATRERLCEQPRDEMQAGQQAQPVHQAHQAPPPLQVCVETVPSTAKGVAGKKIKKKKKRNAVDEVLCLVARRLRQEPDISKKIADSWAAKLRQMDKRQQIYAEKFINDILFEGALGNLHRDSVLFTTTSHMPASPTPTHSELNHYVPSVTYDNSEDAMDTKEFANDESQGNGSNEANDSMYPYSYYAQQQAQAQAQQEQAQLQQAQEAEAQQTLQQQEIDSDIEIDTKFHINTDLHSFN